MNQYALVTGADHGVGFCLVADLLERGYFVFAGRINPEEKLLEQLKEKFPDRLEIILLDIGSDGSVVKMKGIVSRKVPYINLLINNAGILGDISKSIYDELDFEEMQQVLNVNALGTLRVTNALADLVMKSNQKLIVNISSEAGSIGQCEREGWFAYCMSKAANNMQSALVHNKIRKEGGKVVIIHPGHVATYMRGHLDRDAKITPEESAEAILKLVLDKELPMTEKPLYLDYQGEPLVW